MHLKNKLVAAFALAVLVLPGVSLAQTMSVAQLQAQINALLAQLQVLQTQLAAQTTAASSTVALPTSTRVCPAWGCNGPIPIPTPIRWHFPVGTSTITIASPVGGEQLTFGSTRTIQWADSLFSSTSTYTVFITAQNGNAYGVAGTVVGGTKLDWQVGSLTNMGATQSSSSAAWPIGSNYYVQVVKQNVAIYDYAQSLTPFSIVPSAILLPPSRPIVGTTTTPTTTPKLPIGVACPLVMPYCPYGSHSVTENNGCSETICNPAPIAASTTPVTTTTPILHACPLNMMYCPFGGHSVINGDGCSQMICNPTPIVGTTTPTPTTTPKLPIGVACPLVMPYCPYGSHSVTENNGCSETICNPAPAISAPTVTISASPTTISLGQSFTITWSSTNATNCTASNGWYGPEAVSGSQSVVPAKVGAGTYTMTCASATGTSAPASVTVTATTSGGGAGTVGNCPGGSPVYAATGAQIGCSRGGMNQSLTSDVNNQTAIADQSLQGLLDQLTTLLKSL